MQYRVRKYSVITCSIIALIVIKIGECQKTNMKAVMIHKFGRPRTLEINNATIPKIGEDQVLVKVMACGINPVDVYIRSGKHPSHPELPAILGKEIAGIIRKLGQHVTKFEKGDRVYCGIPQGGYAEFVAANASDCYPLPARLSFSQGASLYIMYFSVTRALVQKANLTSGEVLLVHGAKGSFGSVVVQVAKAAGATVVATVGSTDASTLMRRSKADVIVDQSVKDYVKVALEKAEKEAFDVIVEINTNANYTHDKQYLAPYGRMVVLGHRSAADDKFQTSGPEEGTLIQVNLNKYTEEEQNKAAEFISNAADKSWIIPIIGRGYRLEDAPVAHKELDRTKAERGKLVFVF